MRGKIPLGFDLVILIYTIISMLIKKTLKDLLFDDMPDFIAKEGFARINWCLAERDANSLLLHNLLIF